ncbi:MAG: signal peptidase I [Clostridiales bacterium]|nr:signal peptidase I [Clostridiales bacterium]
MDGEANGEEKKNPWKDILDLVVYCAVILLITFLIVHFVGQRTEVIGNSMVPTLADGDNLIVDKISYRFRDPERFDIIVFPSPDEPGKNYIKRIIGLPGETVQIDGDVIYINGQLLEENYGAEPMQYSGTAQEGVILGEDEYFVLGDNRNVSKDSRYDIVGNISRDDIIGRAWLRIWPLRQFGFLKHQ